MFRELESMKNIINRRIANLSKLSGTEDRRRELTGVLGCISMLESVYSCENCVHWFDGCEFIPFGSCARINKDCFMAKDWFIAKDIISEMTK